MGLMAVSSIWLLIVVHPLSAGAMAVAVCRRNVLGSAILVATTTACGGATATAAETVGKANDCDSSTCLGVWDGLLADCPHTKSLGGGASCTSSQDDTPGIFSEPWDYSEASSIDWEMQQKRLLVAIQLACSKRSDIFNLILQDGRYIRVEFIDGKTREKSLGEFYFTPDDTTIQFRVGSTSSPNTFVLSLSNIERCELIRKQAGYLKLPVLRNRQRALWFGESAFDSFGPGSAALGPPAEMRTGELEGMGRDVDPNLKIDLVQSFPLKAR